jgi:hypothetical protein
MKWFGRVARIGEKIIAYGVLVRKPEEKRELGIPRRRWDKDIKWTLGNRMGQCGLAQGRDKWRLTTITVLNIWVPRDTGSFLYLTFGFLEKQGVCCIVRVESVRYRELLVLYVCFP